MADGDPADVVGGYVAEVLGLCHGVAEFVAAHTCFFYLDIPDYDDRSVFHSKLMFAIQNANTFEIV